MQRGASRARQNAMRSCVVVLGSVVFGYLSLQVGFKPYLERAQEAVETRELDSDKADGGEISISFPQEEKQKYKDTVLE